MITSQEWMSAQQVVARICDYHLENVRVSGQTVSVHGKRAHVLFADASSNHARLPQSARRIYHQQHHSRSEIPRQSESAVAWTSLVDRFVPHLNLGLCRPHYELVPEVVQWSSDCDLLANGDPRVAHSLPSCYHLSHQFGPADQVQLHRSTHQGPGQWDHQCFANRVSFVKMKWSWFTV